VIALCPSSVAVTIAIGVLSVVSAPEVAENVALLCPECTPTLVGTLRPVLLLAIETAV
jgi:hypothetical protein